LLNFIKITPKAFLILLESSNQSLTFGGKINQHGAILLINIRMNSLFRND
jgi:hypothetical protein